jgi:hypothetical protein
VVPVLAPTPPERLVDQAGRPYFLWDCELTLDEFRARLQHPDTDVRAYHIGKLMRQAKPDDVFSFVSLELIAGQWSRLARYLGERRAFWEYFFEAWERQGRVARRA